MSRYLLKQIKFKSIFCLFLILFLLLSQLTFLAPVVYAAEKFSNTTFDSNLTGWSPLFTTQDQFTTARSAGSINGTVSEPSGTTRTVTDTSSKLSIGSGIATFAASGTAAGDPGLWYPSLSRTAGQTVLSDLVMTTNAAEVGWDSAASGNLSYAVRPTNSLMSVRDNATAITMGTGVTISNGDTFTVAAVMRSTGMYYFIKGGNYGSNWTLLWISTQGSTALLPGAAVPTTSSAITIDNFRVPTQTFMPTPTAYDTFSTASSTSTETTGPDSQSTTALPWTGSTWTVSGGTASNTPTEGSELLTDTGLEAWTTATNLTSWTEGRSGTSSINQETSVVHGGSNAARFDVDSSNSAANIQQSSATVGTWYKFSGWWRSGSGAPSATMGIAGVSNTFALDTTYTQYNTIARAASTNTFTFSRGSATSLSEYLDDLSVKALTPSSLFRTVSTSSADAIIETNVTGPTTNTNMQGGLVLNLDSTSSPSNFIIVYLDGQGNVKVDEVVSGTYTNKASTAVTYSAGATLRAIKAGNSLDIFYNNAKVGTTLSMTANTNTTHGLFSTSSGITFDNFSIWPRSGYSLQDNDLGVVRDTATTYGGSAGSAKLVGTSTAQTFTQTFSIGDTSTYNFTAYAYTDGSAVSSSDLSLYANGSTISTAYESVGGGWYKLTGTVTGTTSSADHGVQVQAGKTVYIDNISLIKPTTSSSSASSCSTSAPGSAPIINSAISGSNSVTLNFTEASNPVSYYALEYGTKSGEYQYGANNIGGRGTNNYTVNDLSAGTTYYFRIRAGNDCATGAWSSEFSGSSLGIQIGNSTSTTQKKAPSKTNETFPSPAPAPSPAPSVEPVSFNLPKFSFPKITLPHFSLPKIVLPTIRLPKLEVPVIAITIPKISLPKIALPVISLPKLSLPQIAMPSISVKLPSITINLNPVFNFIKSISNGISQLANGTVTFIRESIAYAGFVSSERYTSQNLLWGRVSEWISFTGTSFGEIVLDEAPTRISEVKVTKVSKTSATVTWKTNHLSTSKVNYGETLSYGQDIQSDEKVHDHVVKITNLEPNTKYVFEVMSQNKNYVFDAWHEFQTSDE